VTTDYVITITAREKAELLPVERSAVPLGPREVAGSTLATLVSAGTELQGGYLGGNFPAQVGYAAVFMIEQIGSEVAGLQAGDRAFCLGGHRSWQRVAMEGALRVPDSLASEEAVFARLMGVSMSTLTTTVARPPQRALITGLGPVGHLAAQIFHSCGYVVTACDPDAVRREFALQNGLTDVRDRVPLDDPAIAGQVALAVECSGHEQAVLDCCRAVRKRGEVTLVGVPWQRRTDLTAHALLHPIFHNYVVLRSGWEWELPLHETPFQTNSIYGNLSAALRWLDEGRVRVSNLIETAPPDEAQRVYQDLLHNRWRKLAAVFDWRM
jgi:threonine dehydrogenase-like Zn-dependent dehydrogenase